MTPSQPSSPPFVSRQVPPWPDAMPPLERPAQPGMYQGYTVAPGHPAFPPVPSAASTRLQADVSSSSSSSSAAAGLSGRLRGIKREADEMVDSKSADSFIAKRAHKVGGPPAAVGGLTRQQAVALLDTHAAGDDGDFLQHIWHQALCNAFDSPSKGAGVARKGPAFADRDVRVLGEALATRWGGADMSAQRLAVLAAHLSHEAVQGGHQGLVRPFLAGVFAAAGHDATFRQSWLEAFLVPRASLPAQDARRDWGGPQQQRLVATLLSAFPAGRRPVEAVLAHLLASQSPFTLDERILLVSGITDQDPDAVASDVLPAEQRAIAAIGLEIGRIYPVGEGERTVAAVAGPRLGRLLRDLAEDLREGGDADLLAAYASTVMAMVEDARSDPARAAEARALRAAASEALQRILPDVDASQLYALGTEYRQRVWPGELSPRALGQLAVHLLPQVAPDASRQVQDNQVRSRQLLREALVAGRPEQQDDDESA